MRLSDFKGILSYKIRQMPVTNKMIRIFASSHYGYLKKAQILDRIVDFPGKLETYSIYWSEIKNFVIVVFNHYMEQRIAYIFLFEYLGHF